MALTWKQLRDTEDAKLIALHDEVAASTSVGLNYYLEEIQRRQQERAIEASHKLAKTSFWLTVANTALALAAVVIALMSQQ
ncbi:hypothetical protein [Nocardioides sp.]|uniref:hypothetical protein n=1 Tax=Nocardioides sp. TaxID=35761 RepID=UPI002C3CF4BD|nr:hypothetical protein [Nocardioides sp.]HXH78173.1 hypothetical protein [Nocardioides sp.]